VTPGSIAAVSCCIKGTYRRVSKCDLAHCSPRPRSVPGSVHNGVHHVPPHIRRGPGSVPTSPDLDPATAGPLCPHGPAAVSTRAGSSAHMGRPAAHRTPPRTSLRPRLVYRRTAMSPHDGRRRCPLRPATIPGSGRKDPHVVPKESGVTPQRSDAHPAESDAVRPAPSRVPGQSLVP
jgi:hypothetical protein